MRTKSLLPLVLLALAGTPALAQSSASYKLTEHTFNAGSHPYNGSTLIAPSYRVRLDAIGEGIVATGLSSAGYRADASFLAAYPPPGEIRAFTFADKLNFEWAPERSVGTYSVYRDLLATLPAGTYGACFRQNLTASWTDDAATPGAGQGFFYLVTAENRLGEEGTKGRTTSGVERGGTACP